MIKALILNALKSMKVSCTLLLLYFRKQVSVIRSRREEYANNYTTVPQLLYWLTQSVILPFEVTIIIKFTK
jgi:hypothetical protein